jgi:hypothetical protein
MEMISRTVKISEEIYQAFREPDDPEGSKMPQVRIRAFLEKEVGRRSAEFKVEQAPEYDPGKFIRIKYPNHRCPFTGEEMKVGDKAYTFTARAVDVRLWPGLADGKKYTCKPMFEDIRMKELRPVPINPFARNPFAPSTNSFTPPKNPFAP